MRILKGVFFGIALAFFLAVLILVFRFFQERDRKIYEHIKIRHEQLSMSNEGSVNAE